MEFNKKIEKAAPINDEKIGQQHQPPEEKRQMTCMIRELMFICRSRELRMKGNDDCWGMSSIECSGKLNFVPHHEREANQLFKTYLLSI